MQPGLILQWEKERRICFKGQLSNLEQVNLYHYASVSLFEKQMTVSTSINPAARLAGSTEIMPVKVFVYCRELGSDALQSPPGCKGKKNR